MTVRVGNLFRKRTITKLDGSIFSMRDDANGGQIVRDGQVVNHQRFEELKKEVADRTVTATPEQMAVVTSPELLALRNGQASEDAMKVVLSLPENVIMQPEAVNPEEVKEVPQKPSSDPGISLDERFAAMDKKIDDKFDAILALLQPKQ